MALPRRVTAAAVLACGTTIAGCGGQSTLSPKSRPAHDITVLWWWMLAAATIVFLGAVFLLLLGWVRRRKPGFPLIGRSEPVSNGLVVTFGIFIPAATLIALFIAANFVVASDTSPPSPGSTQMTIQVTGKQWFWQVRYPGTTAVTANEIHIPVRTRVNVVALSGDVIHSFWVPELNRKIDMIPGRTNRVLIEADRPGVYRGQCAELCGLQHANMGMYVIAQPRAQFDAWLRNMTAPRRAPVTPLERRGEQVFLANECAACHQIRGTPAIGQVGPDLTHLMTRTTLAALTIPNRKGYLAGWVLDPQHVKPGNKMPALNLSGPDFQALLAYLESLK
jgi:cytochrome c oxidase subunit 2